jgi:monovalent cation:proton antiporter-2 (CPA2) family protein
VLGYLLAGIIIGPFVLKLIGDEGSDVMHFAEFGVVMMLFLIGLELRPSLLWKMKNSIFGLGGLQVLGSTIIIAGIAFILGQNIQQSVTIGLILALSSTAIVLQSLSEKGLLKNTAGQNIFSVLLFQDIAVIPILAILPLFAGQVVMESHDHGHAASETLVSGLPGWQQLIVIIGVVAAIILAGRFLARYAFRFIAESGMREIFTAFALLLVIAIAVAMSSVGLSPALGTFLAGVVLADNEYRHEIESDIEPFKGLLLGLFFIAVGASINFNILFDMPWLIVGLLLALVLVKFLVLFSLGRSFGLKSGQDMLFSFALAQAGEFAFVLIAFSGQNAILAEDTSGILLIVVALSMLITPLLLIVNERIIQPRYTVKSDGTHADVIDEKENQIIIAGFGRFGVVIGRFLRANGIKATILDNNPRNIEVLKKFGFKVFYGDSSRIDLLESAGAKEASILIIAVDDRETISQMAHQARKHFPHLKIFARALDVRHYFELKDIGVDGHRRETYDSSLDLGVKALCAIGFRKYQASRAARTFRYHDEIVMNELHQIWHEEDRKFFSEARRHTEQLENLLLAELDQPLHDADHAWDATTLREEVRELYGRISEEEEE